MNFRKKLALLALLSSGFTLLSAKHPAPLSGRLVITVLEVGTKNSNPLADCLVEIRDEDKKFIAKTKTDDHGKAEFELAYGFYNLYFTKDGYCEGEKEKYEIKSPEQELVKKLYENTLTSIQVGEAIALLKSGKIQEGRALAQEAIAEGLDFDGTMQQILKKSFAIELLEKRLLRPEAEAIFLQRMSNKTIGIPYFPLKTGDRIDKDIYPDLFILATDSAIVDYPDEQLINELIQVHLKR